MIPFLWSEEDCREAYARHYKDNPDWKDLWIIVHRDPEGTETVGGQFKPMRKKQALDLIAFLTEKAGFPLPFHAKLLRDAASENLRIC